MTWEKTVLRGARKDSILSASGNILELINNLCEAQAKEAWLVAQQQLLAWLGDWCEHIRPKFSGNCERRDCPRCMQEIRKSLGMEVKDA